MKKLTVCVGDTQRSLFKFIMVQGRSKSGSLRKDLFFTSPECLSGCYLLTNLIHLFNIRMQIRQLTFARRLRQPELHL